MRKRNGAIAGLVDGDHHSQRSDVDQAGCVPFSFGSKSIILRTLGSLLSLFLVSALFLKQGGGLFDYLASVHVATTVSDQMCDMEVEHTANSLRMKVHVRCSNSNRVSKEGMVWLEYHPSGLESPRLATPRSKSVVLHRSIGTESRQWTFDVVRLRASAWYTVEAFYDDPDPGSTMKNSSRRKCGETAFQTRQLPDFLADSKIERVAWSDKANISLAVQTFHFA